MLISLPPINIKEGFSVKYLLTDENLKKLWIILFDEIFLRYGIFWSVRRKQAIGTISDLKGKVLGEVNEKDLIRTACCMMVTPVENLSEIGGFPMGYEFMTKGADSDDMSIVVNKAFKECIDNGLMVLSHSSDDGPNNKKIKIDKDITDKLKLLLNEKRKEVGEKFQKVIELKDGTHLVHNILGGLRNKDLGYVNEENTLIETFNFDLLLEFIASNKDVIIEKDGISTTVSKYLQEFTSGLLFPKDCMNKTPTKIYLKIIHKLEFMQQFFPNERLLTNIIKFSNHVKNFWDAVHSDDKDLDLPKRISKLEQTIKFFTDWRENFIFTSSQKKEYKEQDIIKVNSLDNSIPVNQINTLTKILKGLKGILHLDIKFNIRSFDTCILESDFHSLRAIDYNPNCEEFQLAYNKAILKNQYKFAEFGYNNHNFRSKVKLKIKAYKLNDFKKLPKQKNVKLSKQEKTRIKNEEKEYKTKILNEINSCELKMLNSTFNFRQSLNLKNSIFDVNKKTKLEEQTIKELDDNLIILDQIVKIYDQKNKRRG